MYRHTALHYNLIYGVNEPNMAIFQAANLIFFSRFCKIVSIFFCEKLLQEMKTKFPNGVLTAISFSIIAT